MQVRLYTSPTRYALVLAGWLLVRKPGTGEAMRYVADQSVCLACADERGFCSFSCSVSLAKAMAMQVGSRRTLVRLSDKDNKDVGQRITRDMLDYLVRRRDVSSERDPHPRR